MIVQLYDVQAPEQPTAARGLEVRQEPLQDGTALVLELVVQAEEGAAKFFFRDLRDGTGFRFDIMCAAYPKSDAMCDLPFEIRAALGAQNFQLEVVGGLTAGHYIFGFAG